MRKVDELEAALLRQKFSIDREDAEITAQINAILAKKRSKPDEEIMNALVERLLADEARRAKILKELKRLQKEGE